MPYLLILVHRPELRLSLTICQVYDGCLIYLLKTLYSKAFSAKLGGAGLPSSIS